MVRNMKHGFYLNYYVKEAEDNFVRTSNLTPGTVLVFVPGNSTPADLKNQVQKVAFTKQAMSIHAWDWTIWRATVKR
ncbi:hypothetical protein BDU57DRAFT_514052 [Ampelomyces quisqualis]|uniref:Uncharacterized protein n=1 Tax=Ampelomyces quisqualis TaxID=50730 RepID=A0A6A5QS77_AMPQU|nr:hypothetical protein BDU57DRAFT_514052 [Ampelomyces quisqualis]